MLDRRRRYDSGRPPPALVLVVLLGCCLGSRAFLVLPFPTTPVPAPAAVSSHYNWNERRGATAAPFLSHPAHVSSPASISSPPPPPRPPPPTPGRRDKMAPLIQPLDMMKTASLRKSLFLSAKVLNLTRALDTYEEMKKRGRALTRDECNTLLYVCQEAGGPETTWNVYNELKGAFEEDENTAVVLVRSLAEQGRLEEALALIEGKVQQLGTHKPPPKLRIYTPVLTRLWKAGNVAAAKAVWEGMMEKGAVPNEEHVVSMVECYASQGPSVFRQHLEDVSCLLDLLGNKLVLNVTDAGIETLLNAFPSGGSGGGNAAARVRIPGGGVCPHCQGQLQPLRLVQEERRELRERLLVLAEEKQAAWKSAGKLVLSSLTSSTGSSNGSSNSSSNGSSNSSSNGSSHGPSPSKIISLRALEAWLHARPPFDVVLDAPNIAYYGQNFGDGRFNFNQIDIVLEALKAQGKRAFLVIPVKYTNRRIRDHVHREEGQGKAGGGVRALDDEETAMLQRWTDDGIVYRIPRGQLDDLYWMYATVAARNDTTSSSSSSPMVAISNDCMRDHWLDLLEPRPFLRWKTTQVQSYRFDYSVEDNTALRVTFSEMGFSREAQRTSSSSSSSSSIAISSDAATAVISGGDCLHLPSDKAEDEWLCLDFVRARKELDALIAAEEKAARKDLKDTSTTRGLGFFVRPRPGGLFAGWGGTKKRKRKGEDEHEGGAVGGG